MLGQQICFGFTFTNATTDLAYFGFTSCPDCQLGQSLVEGQGCLAVYETSFRAFEKENKMEELWVNPATVGHLWFIAMEKGMRVRWASASEEGAEQRWSAGGGGC